MTRGAWMATVLLLAAAGGGIWWWSTRHPPPVMWQGYAEAESPMTFTLPMLVALFIPVHYAGPALQNRQKKRGYACA